MSEIQKYILEQLSAIVPKYSKLEFRSYFVTNKGYAFEFFVTSSGQEKQCYAMVDDGEIDETQLKKVFDNIAGFIRGIPSENGRRTDKFTFTAER